MPPCACVFVCCEHAPQQSVRASICIHTHTFTYEWIGTPYHQSQGMPGIMGRDVIITKIFFVLFPPPTSFVFDKRSIDPSWPGVLCLLTVKKQAAQTHDYCGYFWKTSMHLIFHLLKNSACWRLPPALPHNSNLRFSQSHTMLFCGMWRPQHTSKVLMLPSVWILKRCPLTHSLSIHYSICEFLKDRQKRETFSCSKCSFTLLWVVLWMLNHCFHPLST